MHAEGPLVADLQAVHADVARARDWIAREHEGQRDVPSCVPRPAAQDGQRCQARLIRLHDFLAGGAAHALGPGLGDVEEVAQLSQLVEEGPGHAQIEQLGHARREIGQVLDAQRRGHPLGRAEGIDEHGHVEPLDLLEEEGLIALAPPLGDAVRDLRDLQIARDAGPHAPELSVLLEMGDELAEVVEGHAATRGSRP